MTFITCDECGQTYERQCVHECPGSPEERIDALEERVEELEEQLNAYREGLAELLKPVDPTAAVGLAALLRRR